MKFRNLISVLFLVWVFNTYSQISFFDKMPRMKVSFSSTTTSQYEYEGDDKIDTWDSSDKVVYKINPIKQRLEFSVYNSLTGEKEINKNLEIIAYRQDDELNAFILLDVDKQIEIWIWKDKSMIVVNEVDYYYLVCEKEKESKNENSNKWKSF